MDDPSTVSIPKRRGRPPKGEQSLKNASIKPSKLSAENLARSSRATRSSLENESPFILTLTKKVDSANGVTSKGESIHSRSTVNAVIHDGILKISGLTVRGHQKSDSPNGSPSTLRVHDYQRVHSSPGTTETHKSPRTFKLHGPRSRRDSETSHLLQEANDFRESSAHVESNLLSKNRNSHPNSKEPFNHERNNGRIASSFKSENDPRSSGEERPHDGKSDGLSKDVLASFRNANGSTHSKRDNEESPSRKRKREGLFREGHEALHRQRARSTPAESIETRLVQGQRPISTRSNDGDQQKFRSEKLKRQNMSGKESGGFITVDITAPSSPSSTDQSITHSSRLPDLSIDNLRQHEIQLETIESIETTPAAYLKPIGRASDSLTPSTQSNKQNRGKQIMQSVQSVSHSIEVRTNRPGKGLIPYSNVELAASQELDAIAEDSGSQSDVFSEDAPMPKVSRKGGLRYPSSEQQSINEEQGRITSRTCPSCHEVFENVTRLALMEHTIHCRGNASADELGRRDIAESDDDDEEEEEEEEGGEDDDDSSPTRFRSLLPGSLQHEDSMSSSLKPILESRALNTESPAAVEIAEPLVLPLIDADLPSAYNEDAEIENQTELSKSLNFRKLPDADLFTKALENSKARSTADLYIITENASDALAQWQTEWIRLEKQVAIAAGRKPRDPMEPDDFVTWEDKKEADLYGYRYDPNPAKAGAQDLFGQRNGRIAGGRDLRRRGRGKNTWSQVLDYDDDGSQEPRGRGRPRRTVRPPQDYGSDASVLGSVRGSQALEETPEGSPAPRRRGRPRGSHSTLHARIRDLRDGQTPSAFSTETETSPAPPRKRGRPPKAEKERMLAASAASAAAPVDKESSPSSSLAARGSKTAIPADQISVDGTKKVKSAKRSAAMAAWWSLRKQEKLERDALDNHGQYGDRYPDRDDGSDAGSVFQSSNKASTPLPGLLPAATDIHVPVSSSDPVRRVGRPPGSGRSRGRGTSTARASLNNNVSLGRGRGRGRGRSRGRGRARGARAGRLMLSESRVIEDEEPPPFTPTRLDGLTEYERFQLLASGGGDSLGRGRRRQGESASVSAAGTPVQREDDAGDKSDVDEESSNENDEEEEEEEEDDEEEEDRGNVTGSFGRTAVQKMLDSGDDDWRA